MKLSVEVHDKNPEAKRMLAVPSNERGIFVNVDDSPQRVFRAIGIVGVTDEQIAAVENNSLAEMDMFEVVFARGVRRAMLAPRIPKELGLVALVRPEEQMDIRVFEEYEPFLFDFDTSQE